MQLDLNEHRVSMSLFRMFLESDDMSRTGFCVNTSPAPYFVMLVNLIAVVGRNSVDVLHDFGISTTNSEREYFVGT